MRGSGQDGKVEALRLGYSAGRAGEAPALAARLRQAGVAVALELEPTARHREEPVIEGMARLDDDGAVVWRYRGEEGRGVEALLAAHARGTL